MGMTDSERVRIARAVQHVFNPAPNGPLLPHFDALELAQAIERQLATCAEQGHTKLSMHLDLVDAQALATALRKLALLR